MPSETPPAPQTRTDGAILLTIPPQNASDQNPAFSPDGATLLFTRFEQGYNDGPAALYILDLATGSIRLLASAPDSDNVNLPGSCWNAASGRIVFSSDRQDVDEIWSMEEDGRGLFRVTRHDPPIHFIEPSFSPDGEWIVFGAMNDAPDDSAQGSLWKVRADGSELTQLTDGPGGGTDDRQPNWSPDGERILFQRRLPGSDDWNLFTMQPDGRDLRQVTFDSSSDTDASWSPGGEWIVYSSDLGDLLAPGIFIVSVNGGAPIRVTHDDLYADSAPSWSPDGKWIGFESRQRQPDESAPTSLWMIQIMDTFKGGER